MPDLKLLQYLQNEVYQDDRGDGEAGEAHVLFRDPHEGDEDVDKDRENPADRLTCKKS